MNENEKYLKENGLPRRLVFQDGHIGEYIGNGGGPGAFRNLFAISKCYGVYAEAIGKELVKRYNPAPVFQLHWEFNDRTEMKSQCCPEEALHGNPNSTVQKEIRKWTKEVQDRHPLPEGARWLMVNEESEHFLWAVEPAEV